jgi:Flp pilus assembly protein CpaB
MLTAEEDLPDNPTAQLREGQSAYTLETDLARLGGTILPGQKVDIYASLTDRNGSPVSGCLIENARVIAVKDHKGLDLDDPESSGTPYLTILAVMRRDLPYLSAAETAGSVRLIASVQTYASDVKEARLVEDSELLAYLKRIMVRTEEAALPSEFPATTAG